MPENSFYYNSPVGALYIASNETGITAVSFVNRENKQVMEETLIDYTKPVEGVLLSCFNQLEAYFDGKLRDFDLPLAQQGTEFQQSIWDALTCIPYGETTSYLALSKKLGNVKAIRAVGTANGRNNIAIIVPCHRVIGSNGDLVGYAGDLWRKKWLLSHEAAFSGKRKQMELGFMEL